jgi:hypothetical protein
MTLRQSWLIARFLNTLNRCFVRIYSWLRYSPFMWGSPSPLLVFAYSSLSLPYSSFADACTALAFADFFAISLLLLTFPGLSLYGCFLHYGFASALSDFSFVQVFCTGYRGLFRVCFITYNQDLIQDFLRFYFLFFSFIFLIFWETCTLGLKAYRYARVVIWLYIVLVTRNYDGYTVPIHCPIVTF